MATDQTKKSSTADALIGPYSLDWGRDAYLHPTNSYGRCEQLNTTGVCPTSAQQALYLTGLPNDVVMLIAGDLGIAIPLIHTNVILVPLIIAIQFP